MKKKFKAFTLVELIVAIAVFGILMAGVVKMIQPLSDTTTNAAVLNNQRTVENAIVTYIGENLRYASNLAIIEGGTAEEAVKTFISLGPADSKGMAIDYSVQANKDKIKVIAFDKINTYPYRNNQFYGRVISTTEGKSGNLDFSYSNLKSDGSSNQYLVFGDEYYAQGDYTLDARICNNALCLSIYSDYYYTANKGGKFSSTSATPTRGTYELRTMSKGQCTGNVFACLTKDQSKNTNHCASTDPTSKDPIIYFVYTYPNDEVTNTGVLANATPGGNADCTRFDGTGGSGGSSGGSSGGNS